MNEYNEVENEESVPTAEPEETPEPSQETDPVEEELERIETTKRTKLEKLEYTKQRIEKQLAEERRKEGIVDEDDRPLTVREFRALQAQEAQYTAKQLVENLDVPENVKRLAKHHLDNTVKPSGDPQTDLTNALALVEAVRNRQLGEEAARAAKVRTAPSSPSAPPKTPGSVPEFTKEERAVMRGFKLTEEEAAQALRG